MHFQSCRNKTTFLPECQLFSPCLTADNWTFVPILKFPGSVLNTCDLLSVMLASRSCQWD